MRRDIIFIFLISFLITYIWFSSGKQLATGEESFSMFNSIPLEKQTSIWQETGMGYPMPVYINRFIPIAVVQILLFLNVLPFLIQAFFYFILIFIGMFGMSLLVKELLKRNSFVTTLVPTFYFFNLYSQTQVFNRFLYSGIFAWAFLPLSLFLWIRWTKTYKFIWVVLFCLFSVAFSLSYLQPASIITLWTPLLGWSIYLIGKGYKEKKKLGQTIIASILGLLLWLIFNIWWIYPDIKMAAVSFSEVSNTEGNFASLQGLSKGLKISDIFTLYHGLFMARTGPWGSWYQNSSILFLRWIAFFLAIIGLVFSRKKKFSSYLFGLALISLFIIKGTNPPFGYAFFRFLFIYFPFLEILRNPYEKFGIVWLLTYAIFFTLGLKEIYTRVHKKIKVFFLPVALSSYLLLIWPMFTGDVYTSGVRVSIPGDYREANDFLNQNKSDGRILMLPIVPGDGVRYVWGYQGVEPSEFFFDRPAISKVLRTKYFDDKYWELEKAFVQGKPYNQFLNETNTKYLILHNDLIPEASGASSSAQTKEILSKNPQIQFLKNFGELELYEYKGNKDFGLFVTDEGKKPVLDYKKLSTTHYVVTIKGAEKPFKLIFRETYNDLWETRIDKQKVDRHFLAYGYANGWEINKTGDYNIDIVLKIWPWE